jgi:hypothetical protein
VLGAKVGEKLGAVLGAKVGGELGAVLGAKVGGELGAQSSVFIEYIPPPLTTATMCCPWDDMVTLRHSLLRLTVWDQVCPLSFEM